MGPEDYFKKGVELSETGKHSKAAEMYRLTISLDPNHARAYNNLGSTYDKRGRPVDAMMAYLKAVEINKDYALAHYNLGLYYNKNMKFRKALNHLEEAIRIIPDFVKAYYELGVSYRGMGALCRSRPPLWKPPWPYRRRTKAPPLELRKAKVGAVLYG